MSEGVNHRYAKPDCISTSKARLYLPGAICDYMSQTGFQGWLHASFDRDGPGR